MGKLVLVDGAKLDYLHAKRAGRERVTDDIDDLNDFIKYGARIVSALCVVKKYGRELFAIFATILKHQNKEDTLCSLTRMLTKSKSYRKNKNTRTNNSQPNDCTKERSTRC